MATTFTFNGRLAIDVDVNGQTVRLVGTADLATSATIALEFKAPPSQPPLVVGTLDGVIQSLLDQGWTLKIDGFATPAGPNPATALANEIVTRAQALPGFGPMFQQLAASPLSLTEFRVDLNAPATAAGALSGAVTIGLALDTSGVTLPAIPGAQIKVKGIAVLVKFRVG
jgi:hypothetical protein